MSTRHQQDQDRLRSGQPEQRTSLFAAILGHLDGRTRTREQRKETVEVGLGFLGFFCLMSLGVTVAAELRGHAALTEALISAVLVAMTWSVYRLWRRLGGTLRTTPGPRR